MYNGRVPLLTKGPLVTFYGGQDLLEEVSDDPPGQSLVVLAVFSIAFQLALFIFKWNFSRKIDNYALNLKATLVNNVRNIYGLLILTMISLIGCSYAIYHYLSIKHFDVSSPEPSLAGPEMPLMPAGLLLFYLLALLVVLLPYIQNFALRSGRQKQKNLLYVELRIFQRICLEETQELLQNQKVNENTTNC